jgi:hypothetical protein
MTRRLTLFAALALGCGGSSSDGGDDDTGPDSSGSADDGPSSGGPDDGSSGGSSGDDTGSTGTDPTTGVDSTDGSTGDTDGVVTLDGACPLETKVGTFNLIMEPLYTTFSGTVADGVVPISVLENVGEGSGCTLLRRNNPFCDPGCAPTETCDFDGTCLPYPQNHDVGTVTITGLLQPVMEEPTMPSLEYFDTNLMHPAFDPGAEIFLSATGGDYRPFELTGLGVAMIEPTIDELVMDETMPLSVEWTPVGNAGTIRVELSVDQHGATPVKMVCESEDTGSLEIPADLVAQFTGFGVTGYPSATYFRETVDSVDITPGCVEFGVRARATGGLSVVGHTPCDSQDDCPDGEVCNLKIQTCE